MRERIYGGFASATFLLGLAFLGLDGNFASSRKHYDFFSNGWAYLMYTAFGLAVFFAALTIRAWPGAKVQPASPPKSALPVTAFSPRPTFTSRILNEGKHFFIEITNEGPTDVPDPPLLLNLLLPKAWKVTAGDGKWSPFARESGRSAKRQLRASSAVVIQGR
jgi:hypothetical protein